MDIETEARRVLENAHRYPSMREFTASRLRLWHYPAFEPWRSWSVLSEGEEQVVRRVTWQPQPDAAGTAPVTHGAEAVLPKGLVANLATRLRGIVLPPFIPATHIGADGESFGIAFGDLWRASQLSWWGEPPKEWMYLARLFDATLTGFEKLLPTSTG